MRLLQRLWWTAYLACRLRGQVRYAFKPLAAVRRDQARRVRRIVAHAYRRVPYYRETMGRLGLSPADFRAADDLAKLPILERDQLQRDPGYFRSAAGQADSPLLIRTSGSSGKAVEIALDRPAVLLGVAFFERLRAVAAALVGRRFGYREASFASSRSTTDEIGTYCRAACWRPGWARIERRYFDLVADPAENLAGLSAYQPDVIFASGTSLQQLLAAAQATGRPFPRPKAILYSSDGLPAAARRQLLDVLRLPVFSWYGAVECLSIAFECEQHRALHLNLDHCALRIVDAAGRPLPPGETGDVVVSNLFTRATVLLNYRLGDLAALLPGPCPCGRSLPLLSFPPGRRDDLVVLPSGRTLHPQAVRTLLEDRQDVWEFQLVQETPSRFRILLVPAPACDRAQLAAAVARQFAERFGSDVTTEVCLVDAIDRTAAGKHRMVISRLQQDPVVENKGD